MNPSILLLDCSKALEEKLKRQGFDVASGSVGYPVGTRFLPGPIYEYDVIIYNPKSVIRSENVSQMADASKVAVVSKEKSPLEVMLDSAREAELRTLDEFAYGNKPTAEFSPLAGHIQRGANVLIFINHISDNLTFLNAAYSWVPNMPEVGETRDSKPFTLVSMLEELPSSMKPFRAAIAEVSPLLTVENLKRPVLQKIMINEAFTQAAPLFFNRQMDFLGLSLKVGAGRIIVLPEYEDNESVISDFLNRVLPRIYGQPSHRDIVDVFISPMEKTAKEELQSIDAGREALGKRFEQAKVELASAERLKKQTIAADETAVRIIGYYRTATQQEDVALFYLYKIIEALEKQLGGEKAAKDRLGKHGEWNLIGRIANASYGDIRHAPKPGEKIKEWTKEEIADCFAAAERVLTGYFSILF